MLISEDRIRGRRLILKNGQLVVEKIEPLPAEQVALLADALANALKRESPDGHQRPVK